MRSAEIQTALAAAVEEVLETMCFSAVLASSEGRSPPEAEAEAAPAVGAELYFHGEPSGGFRLALTANAARAVGAGFLGKEESEVSEPEAAEVVCELANMICGSVLSQLESQTEFRLTHPELAPTESESFAQTGAWRWFDLGEGHLITSLRLQ
jgi:CheY-specific phosphatase CheX